MNSPRKSGRLKVVTPSPAPKVVPIAANIAAQYPEANDLGVSVLIGTGLVLFLITFVVNFIARKLTEKASV